MKQDIAVPRGTKCMTNTQKPDNSQVFVCFVGEPGIDHYIVSTRCGYFFSLHSKNISHQLRFPHDRILKRQSKDWRFSICRGAGNRTRTARSQTEYTTTMLHPDVAREMNCLGIQSL